MKRRQFRVTVIFKLYLTDLLTNIEMDLTNSETKVYNNILTNLTTIDQTISNSLKNYTLNRLAYLDRAIVRYATYEMLFTDTPRAIIIDEAIEITKEYSDIDDLQKAFTNRLLDNINKSIGEKNE
ncbi:MAG: transcription antitermination protein NusB [Acholeplasmataceae bacterium]|jgi:N utilization substance protein B|nr:transcription antitermination protein NusB [Acholeplasmataceae bacterium]